jgi:hypothetical protein
MSLTVAETIDHRHPEQDRPNPYSQMIRRPPQVAPFSFFSNLKSPLTVPITATLLEVITLLTHYSCQVYLFDLSLNCRWLSTMTQFE